MALIEQVFWWSAVTGQAAWFYGSSLILRQVKHNTAIVPVITPGVLAVSAAALVLIVLGTATNLLVDYSTALPAAFAGTWVLTSGALYPLYITYNGVVMASALVNFARALLHISPARTDSQRAFQRQLQLLTGGGFVFVIGALWLSSNYHWDFGFSPLVGYVCLFVGLALLGYGIAAFGMLVEGQDIRRDFIYTFTSISLLLVLYVGLLLVVGNLSASMTILLIGLVIVTHTAFDSGRALLDRLFFSRAERTARAEARAYATVLGTSPVVPPAFVVPAPVLQPDEADPEPDEPAGEPDAPAPEALTLTQTALRPASKAFQDQVRRAITDLKSPPQLSQSSLLTLPLVTQRLQQTGQDDNRLSRATALRELLIEQIDNLQPGDDMSSRVGDAWRFYNVLHYPYVREISRKTALSEARRLEEQRRRNGQRDASELEQVLLWLADIDENTFYKWQRRASDTIATILWEENSKLAATDGQR
ncbi:MAG: hypothetical protein HC876_02250 [Chloroflexaceae bacterium]|nr:hypothetical protein [Chloroflexaceae bacterium]